MASRPSTSTSSTTARASRRGRRIAPSSGSGGPIPRDPARAPASVSRSSASWRRRTAAWSTPRTRRHTAPASASRSRGFRGPVSRGGRPRPNRGGSSGRSGGEAAPAARPTMPRMDIVELRSDTFTRPTREMLQAMAEAELGDDVWGTDPTANALQEHCAELFGKEAGLYVPSGTMGNETSLKALTNPGDDVITDSRSHVVLFEQGAPGVISGVVLRTIETPDGRLPVDAVKRLIDAASVHTSRPSLIRLEHIRAVAAVAHENGLKVFLDGARIFNASIASGTPIRAYAAEVDALSFCFSKGLGAPVGSMILGTSEMIERAWHIRQ